jgi:hypothetical protein
MPDTDQFRWSVDVHNMVNEKLGKPVMTLEEAYAHWMSGCEPEVPDPEPLFDSTTILLMVLLVAFIFSILLKNYRK